MDFFFRGKIEISNITELDLLMKTQKKLKTIPIKTGTLQRQVVGEGYPDRFVFEVRTEKGVQARNLYEALQELMETNNIHGWMGWHECRHDEGLNGCTWNETFQWPPEGV